jgi:hypothetical protein
MERCFFALQRWHDAESSSLTFIAFVNNSQPLVLVNMPSIFTKRKTVQRFSDIVLITQMELKQTKKRPILCPIDTDILAAGTK